MLKHTSRQEMPATKADRETIASLAKFILRQCIGRRWRIAILSLLLGVVVISSITYWTTTDTIIYRGSDTLSFVASQVVDDFLTHRFSIPRAGAPSAHGNNVIPLPPTADFTNADELDVWVSTGKLDSEATGVRFAGLHFDVVYTWVNGSEKRLRNQKAPWEDRSNVFHQDAAKEEQVGRSFFRKLMASSRSDFGRWKHLKTDKRYRDFDELRYSIRSVEQNLADLARQITIVSTDFPVDDLMASQLSSSSSYKLVRFGQVPQWLDPSILSDPASARLRMVHHSQIYHPLHLPTFNSLSIESHLVDIPHLLPHFIYMNDDLFFGARTTASDFWTPLYGFVFHAEHSLLVKSTNNLVLDDKNPAGGEWTSLEWTNELLSSRFGRRNRHYIAHIHHMISTPILREIYLEWPEAMAETSSHRFRGEGWDVHTTFLFTHYVIERRREALLHSYLTLRVDRDADGFWSWDERHGVLALIDKWQGNWVFRSPARSTMTMWRENMRKVGIQDTQLTGYAWSSADGHAFTKTMRDVYGQPVDGEYYDTDYGAQGRVCVMDIEKCFPVGFTDENVDKVKVDWHKVAFDDVACGDCLMMMLVAESGEEGLEAFLPTKDALSRKWESWGELALLSRTPPSDFDPLVLVPPGTPSFLNPFTIDPAISIRQRTIARIHRYAYTIGTTRSSFVSLQDPVQVRYKLQTLLTDQDPVKYSATPEGTPTVNFCLNDDFESDSLHAQWRMRKYVREFLEAWFPKRAAYERWWWERVKGWRQTYKLPGEPGREMEYDEMVAEENKGKIWRVIKAAILGEGVEPDDRVLVVGGQAV
ncbi:hypothetical protein BC937DRAFT_87753 [Endogone sp. FLAS-F59071]|nr:hypothetical protein BC937DRAFT_87753 [Endogone sp. FLAS-F59071]|eukprot:RUS19263.1 hypothetical protein BC937DRAFT_87753 [Endogone sp. FLAS-F59071]